MRMEEGHCGHVLWRHSVGTFCAKILGDILWGHSVQTFYGKESCLLSSNTLTSTFKNINLHISLDQSRGMTFSITQSSGRVFIENSTVKVYVYFKSGHPKLGKKSMPISNYQHKSTKYTFVGQY